MIEKSKQSKGGVARSVTLSPQKRSEIAKMGAKKRWGIQATHKGSFQNDFGIDVECYVLDDENKTAVISKRGMAATLGMSEGGDRVVSFFNSKKMVKYAGENLLKKLSEPIVFRGIQAGEKKPITPVVHGYDATILIDACNAILNADKDGVLSAHHEIHRKQAQVIVGASSKLGIKQLVYALAGYKPEFDEVIRDFKQFLVDEISRDYAKEFPVDLYLEWSKIYNFPLKMGRNHHVKCRWLTIDHVYTPLLRSNGILLDLLRKKREQDDKGAYKRLFQYLNEEVGAPALRKHIQQLLAIAKVAKGNKARYESDFNTLFGVQLEFDLKKIETLS